MMNVNGVSLRSNAGMANQRYIRGANFERWVLAKLREQGYDGMRSAGSHSCADICIWETDYSLEAVDNPNIYLIQCKTSQSREFNLTDLIWQDEVRELTAMPECFTKVLLVKQYRLITQVIWKPVETFNKFSRISKWSAPQWVIKDVFKLK